MNKMAAPTGQHGKYLFWPQLLNRLSDFHAVFTGALYALTREIGATVPLKNVDSSNINKRLYVLYCNFVSVNL